MPRYFFHITDGRSIPDREGSELPDLAAARTAAVRLSGECLRDLNAGFWDAEEWKLEVCDEGGYVLFVLRFSAELRDAP